MLTVFAVAILIILNSFWRRNSHELDNICHCNQNCLYLGKRFNDLSTVVIEKDVQIISFKVELNGSVKRKMYKFVIFLQHIFKKPGKWVDF